jgi:hypothetical protein
MYAITFFKLVENSLKLDGEDYRILANIYSLPYLNPTQSRNVIKMLDTYGEASEPITSKKIQSDRERLRKILAGNSPV